MFLMLGLYLFSLKHSSEYGLGKLANSLTLGCDCVGEIKYFDGVMTTLSGTPHVIKNAVCLHEEDDSILSKHSDWRLNEVYIKRNRKLIISFIATVGNYEYGFYWNLGLEGSINLQVKHTGIINLCGTKRGEKTNKYGTVLYDGLVAHIHQHIYSVRMDMCVDGIKNSIAEMNVQTEKRNLNPFGNAFYATETVLKTESDAKRDIVPSRFWKM
jgi:primary-amine oxidase